jgi:hypothetical protein
LGVNGIPFAFALFRFELRIPARFYLGVEDFLPIIVLGSLSVRFNRTPCVLVYLVLRDLYCTGNCAQIRNIYTCENEDQQSGYPLLNHAQFLRPQGNLRMVFV